MPLLKSDYREAVQEMFDDPLAQRWTATKLDKMMSMVYDSLWSEILDTNSYWNSQYQQISIPLRVPGYIDTRLIADGGDLNKRVYRIQQVIAAGRHFFHKDPRDYLMFASTNTGDLTTVRASNETQFSYQFLGDQLWLHPLGAVTTFVELRYSYRPTKYISLGDSSSVEFPEGCEDVFVLYSAARAMTKGAVEDANVLFGQAGEAKRSMLNAIRRRSHGMMQPFGTDSSASWGGT